MLRRSTGPGLSPSFFVKRVGVDSGRAMDWEEWGERKIRWLAACRVVGSCEGDGGVSEVARMGGVLV